VACAPPPPDRQPLDRFHYRIFGLLVRANCAVPGASAADVSSEAPDLEIVVRHPGVSSMSGDGDVLYENRTRHPVTGSAMLRILRNDRGFVFRHGDGTQCAIDERATQLTIDWPVSPTEDPWDFVLGLAAGCLLTLRGTVTLHAVALALDDGVVLLAGWPGTGKTTLGAGLVRRGARAIADDVAALAQMPDGVAVHLGITNLRPRSAAIPALRGMGFSDEWWTPSPDPSFVDITLPAERHAAGNAVRIGSVWLLAPDANGARISIEPVAPADALAQMVADSWSARIQSRTMRAREFEAVSRIVNDAPVWRLHYDCSDSTWLTRAVDDILIRHRARTKSAPVS
jgi:hypothetical protein